MKAELEVIAGADRKRFRLDPGRSINIGRSRAADFQIFSGFVSRLHCQLQHDGKEWVLTDLDSRNGTWLNDERIHAHELKDGEVFTLGKKVQVRFTVLPSTAEVPAREREEDESGVVSDLVGREISGIRIAERLPGPGPVHRLRGHQPSLNRHVLLHAFRKDALAAAGLKERLLEEVRRVSKLLHPNILQIHDFVEHAGVDLVVMEYFPGSTLEEILSRRKFVKITEALGIASQVAEGLAYAQDQRQYVDRLFPSEIFVDEAGEAKLQFFRPPFPRQVEVRTLTYVAPEIISGGRLRSGADRPADPGAALPAAVYSLGAILYHMLAGIPPHEGETRDELLPRILKEDPPALRRVNLKVSPALARIVERAMSRDPKARPPDFKVLRADLRKIVSPAR